MWIKVPDSWKGLGGPQALEARGAELGCAQGTGKVGRLWWWGFLSALAGRLDFFQENNMIMMVQQDKSGNGVKDRVENQVTRGKKSDDQAIVIVKAGEMEMRNWAFSKRSETSEVQ